MIGLDTNVLARYYIDDDADEEALKQRKPARNLIESGQPLMICKTVLLEFEWVMRGYYGFKPRQVQSVFHHLLSLSHLKLEDRSSIDRAVNSMDFGIDFADALHYESYKDCKSVATFDNKKFARRMNRQGAAPRVMVIR